MVVDLAPYFGSEQYRAPQAEKGPRFLADLNRLTTYHREHCEPYRRILEATGHPGPDRAQRLDEVPALPVRLFKEHELRSIEPHEVFKVLRSSGTTSQRTSRIDLDIETSRLQVQALTTIMSSYLGPKRLPMIIVDHPGVVTDRDEFSARGAGVLGMKVLGRDHFYALDEDMRLDIEGLRAWLEDHQGQEVLLFGFTFMVWQYLASRLEPGQVDLSMGILIHSGGWKKLKERAVTGEVFKERLRTVAGLRRSHDFYGMVEQVGSVFVECETGSLHAPDFGDVATLDPNTWAPTPIGVPGVLEVFSLLPRSYPGHALITEDLGVVLGTDDCGCGRLGRRFEILGRVPSVEIRGCGDTHAYEQEAS